MKKFLLTIAVGLGAFGSAFADEAIFGYCSDSMVGLGVQQSKVWYGSALRIPGEILAGYGNAKLTAVEIGYPPQAKNTEVSIVLFRENEAPFYTQDGVQLVVSEFNTVSLNTPFDLTDEDLFIGYVTQGLSADDYPMGFDGGSDPVPNASYIAYSKNKADLFAVNETTGKFVNWESITQFGNVSIRAVITTENPVSSFMVPLSLNLPEVVRLNEEFKAGVSVRNLGTEPLTKIEAEVRIGDGETSSHSLTIEPIQAGTAGEFTIPGLSYNGGVSDQSVVVVNITAVNGNPNVYPESHLTGRMAFLEDFYTPVAVIEEGTGTECPYCIRGYVGMEYMREKYTDGSYIGIGVHTYKSSDPMYCTAYRTASNTIFYNAEDGGVFYPAANINRSGLFDPSKADCEAMYNKIRSYFALQKVEFTARYTGPDFAKVEVMPVITSICDYESDKLGLAVVTTEDGVGPYGQYNAYAGTNVDMDGYEKKGRVVNLIFNDVARNIESWKGNTSVVPDSFEAEVPVKAESMFIETTGIKELKNSFVVVLLIDTESGRIVNASRIPMPEATLENVDPASVGMIVDDNSEAAYYTIDGIRIYDNNPGPGLYIKKENGKSSKVIIK